MTNLHTEPSQKERELPKASERGLEHKGHKKKLSVQLKPSWLDAKPSPSQNSVPHEKNEKKLVKKKP